MQIVWRTLPKLALPAAIGLGLAYLATSFVPRPAPFLRPPEELRAQGQAYGEESPVRIILERNVLKLESSPFFPLGQPPAPVVVPQTPGRPGPPAQAAFAQADTSVTPQGATAPRPSPYSAPQNPQASSQAPPNISATAPLSGGHSVQGQAVSPGANAAPPGASGLGRAAEASAQAAAGATKSPAGQASARPAAKTPASKTSAANTSEVEAKAPAAQPVPRLGLEGFLLVGVIAGGERPLAMLQVDGAAVSLRLGEQARGWTLISVEPGQVLLQNGGQLRRLELGNAAAHRARTP